MQIDFDVRKNVIAEYELNSGCDLPARFSRAVCGGLRVVFDGGFIKMHFSMDESSLLNTVYKVQICLDPSLLCLLCEQTEQKSSKVFTSAVFGCYLFKLFNCYTLALISLKLNPCLKEHH